MDPGEDIPGHHSPTFKLGDYDVSLPPPSCAGNPPLPLSQREKQVLFLSAAGRTGPEIAEEINVTPNTVATYKRRILEKLGCRSIAEAVALAAAYVMGAEVKLSVFSGYA